MSEKLRVRVVISRENASWIIGKMATRLVAELEALGAQPTLGNEPDDEADINHWMSYAIHCRRAGRASSVFITHIDDPHKTAHLRDLLGRDVDIGLCMSRDMRRALISWGIPEDRLAFILPALDVPSHPAPIRISIATRLYRDGRKRENLLVRLAKESDLSAFHFEIAGAGWERVIHHLESAGASVKVDPGTQDYLSDYSRLIDAMRTCHYYLYLGLDEGSLGTLEALALGLETIVTPQGFHLDIPSGITHPIETYDDLRRVIHRLASERAARIAAVQSWTWEQYASDHILLWRTLLADRLRAVSILETRERYRQPPALADRGVREQTRSFYLKNSFAPSRIADALARAGWFQPIRRAIKRFRG